MSSARRKKSSLLGALIADDDQWKSPKTDSASTKFAEDIIIIEDKRFYRPPGVDPIAFSRVLYQNVTSGRVVSGGETRRRINPRI